MIGFAAKNSRSFLESLVRTRRALEDWRPFWLKWQATGDAAKIQTAWFAQGGPDPTPLRPITVKARAVGLVATKRNAGDFYLALKAGNSDNPNLGVGARRPRNVWTKNTLRSTYLDPKLERHAFEFRPMEFTRLHQRTYYKRFTGRASGTFANGLNPRRIWDSRNLLKSIVRHLQRYFVEVARPAGGLQL